jgi:hypothetical protein
VTPSVIRIEIAKRQRWKILEINYFKLIFLQKFSVFYALFTPFTTEANSSPSNQPPKKECG